jgi:hypothetical protein
MAISWAGPIITNPILFAFLVRGDTILSSGTTRKREEPPTGLEGQISPIGTTQCMPNVTYLTITTDGRCFTIPCFPCPTVPPDHPWLFIVTRMDGFRFQLDGDRTTRTEYTIHRRSGEHSEAE